MVHAKNYETVSTYVKVIQRKLLAYFFRTCIHSGIFAAGGYIVSPPTTACVTALPWTTSIATFVKNVCLYLFATINAQQI